MILRISPVYAALFGNNPSFISLEMKLREAGVEIDNDAPVPENMLTESVELVPTVSFYKDGEVRHLNVTGVRKTTDISYPSYPGQIETLEQALAYTQSFLDANGAVCEDDKRIEHELSLYKVFNGDLENREGVVLTLRKSNGVHFEVKLLQTLEDVKDIY